MSAAVAGGRRLWSDMFHSLRILDYVILAFSLAVFFGVTALAYQGSGTGGEVMIQSSKGIFVYSLARDQNFSVQGPIGESILEIKDGKVRFVDSPCRDKLCVKAGWLSNNGQWAACLPNKVFIRVESAATSSVDVRAY